MLDVGAVQAVVWGPAHRRGQTLQLGLSELLRPLPSGRTWLMTAPLKPYLTVPLIELVLFIFSLKHTSPCLQ